MQAEAAWGRADDLGRVEVASSAGPAAPDQRQERALRDVPRERAVTASLPAMDPRHLIEVFGTVGVFVIVFAESGLLIGFFLPGDSLLFTAGLLAAQGHLSLPVLLIGCFIAAVAGDQVGYVFGRRVGPALFNRPDSRLFRREHAERARAYFARRGAMTIVLARFVPVVRTFAPIVAGVGRMPYRTFVTFNVVGGLVWACGVQILGYVLGRFIPGIDRYLLPVIGLIVAASLAPVAIERFKASRRPHRPDSSRPNVEELH